MSKEKRLLKDTLIYGVGTFGTRLLGFLLLPFYTAVFSKQDYGYVDLITTGSILFITIASLKLFDGAYRFLWDATTDEERTRVVSSILNLVLVNFLIASALCWAFLHATGNEFMYVGLIFLSLAVRIPGEYFQQVVRAMGKNRVYSISGIITGVGMLVFNLIFLGVYDYGVDGYLWALVISYSLSLLYCVSIGGGAAYYRPTVLSPAVLGPLLRYSLPLLPVTITWWIIRLSGRYVLSYFHGLDPVGIYAVSDKLPTFLYMVAMTFYMAWQDSVLRHAGDNKRDAFFTNAMRTYVRAGLSIVVLMTVLLKPFFAIMVNVSYLEAHIYVPCLLLAVFVLCLAGLYDVFFMVEKKTVGILWSSCVAAILSVVLNLLFVPEFGIWATAGSTLVAALALLAIRIYQLRQTIRIHFAFLEILSLLALFLVASFWYATHGWVYWVGSLTILIAVCFINRSDLMYLTRMVKRKLG